MKKRCSLILLLMMLITMNASHIVEANGKVATNETCLKESVIKLKYDMQKAWIEHAWWTRSFIVSNLAGHEDQKDVLDRLMQNQVDIGNINLQFLSICKSLSLLNLSVDFRSRCSLSAGESGSLSSCSG